LWNLLRATAIQTTIDRFHNMHASKFQSITTVIVDISVIIPVISGRA